MANIKSAKKRVLIAEANRVRNVAFKTSIKTAVKKALALATGEDKEALNSAVSKVYQLCDKAVSKGILHKNTAARKKSRLVLAIKKLVNSSIKKKNFRISKVLFYSSKYFTPISSFGKNCCSTSGAA